MRARYAGVGRRISAVPSGRPFGRRCRQPSGRGNGLGELGGGPPGLKWPRRFITAAGRTRNMKLVTVRASAGVLAWPVRVLEPARILIARPVQVAAWIRITARDGVARRIRIVGRVVVNAGVGMAAGIRIAAGVLITARIRISARLTIDRRIHMLRCAMMLCGASVIERTLVIRWTLGVRSALLPPRVSGCLMVILITDGPGVAIAIGRTRIAAV